MSMTDVEVRKAIEELLKTSAEFPGEYRYDASWGDLERDDLEVGEMLCSDAEATFVASCCNLAPKLAKFVVEELEYRDQETSTRSKPIDDDLLQSLDLFSIDDDGMYFGHRFLKGRFSFDSEGVLVWKHRDDVLMIFKVAGQLIDFIDMVKGGGT